MWERNGPHWKHPVNLGKPGVYSHILTSLPNPLQKNHSLGPRLFCLGGGIVLIKSNYSFYVLHCIQTWIFFLSSAPVWNISARNLDFHRVLSFMGDRLRVCSPAALRLQPGEAETGAGPWSTSGSTAGTKDCKPVTHSIGVGVGCGKSLSGSLGLWC